VPTLANTVVSRDHRNGSPRLLISVLYTGTPTIYVALHLSSRGRVYPVSGPLLFRKSGTAENRTRDLWNCSHERRIHHTGCQSTTKAIIIGVLYQPLMIDGYDYRVICGNFTRARTRAASSDKPPEVCTVSEPITSMCAKKVRMLKYKMLPVILSRKLGLSH
jgi:hypothetical protein